MSAIFLFAIPGQPFWGYVCDRIGRHRPVVLLAVLVGAGAMLLMPVVVARFSFVLGVSALFSITINSMPANLDGWIRARRRQVPDINYGVARAMGSAGFAVFAVLLGGVYDRWGLGLIFPVFTLFALGAGAIALITPDSGGYPATAYTAGDPAPIHPPDDANRIRSAGLREIVDQVWNHHRYRVFVISSVLLFTAFRAAYTFLPLLVAETGGGNRHIGWAHSIGAGTEIPVIMLTGWILKRVKAERVILVAMFVFFLRMAFYPFVTTPGQIIVLQVLHGPSFGLFLAASVHYIDAIAPGGSKSLFQALAPSLYFGAGSVLGSALGGVVVEGLGVRALFTIVPVQILLAALLFRADSRRLDRKDRRDRTVLRQHRERGL